MRNAAGILFACIVTMGVVHVSSSRAQWVRGGTPVCDLTGRETDPCIVNDGDGGAIIVWRDRRHENIDIYAQRVTADGRLAWTTNGIPVSMAIGRKSEVKVVSDGAGGAIVVWTDRRVEWDIFAQRVRSDGEIAWALDGVPVCMAGDEQESHSITTDGSGGAIVSWVDLRFGWDEYCMYAQRIDSAGSPLWDGDGVQIHKSTKGLGHPQMVPDGEDGVIITWSEMWGNEAAQYAQRINGFGDRMWEGSGALLSGPQAHRSAAWIVQDGAGGAIFTWWDERGDYRGIFAQRMDGEGRVQWRKNDAVVCVGPGNQMYPRLIRDDRGGAILVWHDGRNSSWDIYAQRLDGRGRIEWNRGGVPVCTADGHQRHPRIVPDGTGGAYILWSDERNGTGNSDIYGQRIDADGKSLWRENGEPLITEPGDQFFPEAVSDGEHGVILTWTDGRPGAGGIYALRLDPKNMSGMHGN